MMQLEVVLITVMVSPAARAFIFHIPINNEIRTSSVELHPFFTPDSSYPLLYKTAQTLARSGLSCQWRTHKHYCRLRHFLTCLRPEQLQEAERTSSVYVTTAGGLGNHMSTFAATVSLKHRLGVRGLLDLTTFQILDQVFNNIRAAGLEILEEVICDPAGLVWDTFNGHIRDLEPPSKGKVLTLWSQGLPAAEHRR